MLDKTKAKNSKPMTVLGLLFLSSSLQLQRKRRRYTGPLFRKSTVHLRVSLQC